MRIDVTLRRGEQDRDVAIVAPEPVRFADVAADLAQASGLTADAGWWSGTEHLPGTAQLGTAGLRTGAILTRGGPAAAWTSPGVLALHQVGGPDAGRVLPLERGQLCIGRGGDCDVVVSDLDVSRRHARVEISSTAIRLLDLGSTNGTHVDDARLGPDGVDLHVGNRIRIGDSTFEVVGPVETPAASTAAPDGSLRLVRPPRLVTPPMQHEIEMPVEVTASRPRGVQWVAAVLPAAAGGVLAWMMHAPQFLLFALLSPLMMLSTSVGDRLHWRRSKRQAAADFARRSTEADAAVAAGLRTETDTRRFASPDPAAVLRICVLPGSRIWERRGRDEDFLQLRVGTGDVASRLTTRTGSVIAPASTLRGVPICVDLCAGPVGIVGPADVAAGVARWLVSQIAGLHSPVEASITFVLSPKASPRWHWARWLPHTSSGAAIGESEWSSMVVDLTVVVEQRLAARDRGPSGWGGAWQVLVVDSAKDLADVPGFARLLARGTSVGVTALCIDEEEAGLPAACRSVLRIRGETGTRGELRRESGATNHGVVLDDVSSAWSETIARSLAPAVDASGNGLGALPDSCRLLDIVGLDTCGDDDEQRITERWSASAGTADTPVGIGADGPVRLDLVRDGPHALIAGTTGSGKSELLQTLVAGLATQHPPDLLTFLLIDYKGGAAFAECARLPHTVGLVTDLNSQLTERALRSLNSELRRRERLFADAGAADLVSYRAASEGEAMARLIIVVDEFATLAEELPEFVRGLVAVAQRGRSLGVHLVLATQRPGGAVSAEIRANTTTRIALRVTDPGESTDVVDAPDASFIERWRPGRAYLRTGSSLLCFQTAQASGRPNRRSRVAVERLREWRRPNQSAGPDPRPTDLAQVVAAVGGAARRSGRAPGRAPWVPPLPELVSRRGLPASDSPLHVPYALVDLPDDQRRDALSVDLARGSAVLAVGAARSGRTALLTSIALNAAELVRPDDLHLYVIDPSGDLAAAIGELPHCATVVRPDDLAIAPTLLRRLAQALGRGEDRQSTTRHLTASMLLIDNWETVCAALADTDAIECADALAALQRAGPSARLTIVLTGDRTALAPRFAAGFEEKLLLRLSDRTDYGLAGIAPRDAPAAMPPGRALRARDGASVQIAVAGDAPGREAARRYAAELAVRWADCAGEPAPASSGSGARDRGPLPVRLRPLPMSVVLERLPYEVGRFTLGVGGPAAEPVQVDLACGAGRLLVAGPPRSGRSTVLRAILAQAVRTRTHVVVAATGRSPLRRMAEQHGVGVIDPSATAERIGVLASRASLLLVDDCEMYVDEPAGEELAAWARGTDPSFAAVVAGRSEDLATSYRGIGAQVRRTNCGLLLRPGPVDGELLGVRLPRRPSSGPPGRGVLVGEPQWGPMFADGEPIVFQAATP